MKNLIAFPAALLAMQAFGADAPAPGPGLHRYMIERTFPARALDGLDAATKQVVNHNNASVGVRWVQSFANSDRTRTYCIYEGPSEAAVRKAAELNKLPVDKITEVPVVLLPQ